MEIKGITSSMSLKELAYRRCGGKAGFKGDKAFEKAAEWTEKRGIRFIAYKCIDCCAWHVSHAICETFPTEEYLHNNPPRPSNTPSLSSPHPNFIDFTGVATGGVKIIGKSSLSSTSNHGARWDATCQCGRSVVRQTRSIKKSIADGRSLLCTECSAR